MDMALMRAQASALVREVILIWPGELPAHLREVYDAVKHLYPGARVVAVTVRPDAVERIMGYLDTPLEDVPPMYRPLVSLMQRHGVRELPALIVDGRLVAVGDGVEDALRRLLYTPAIA